MASAPAFRKVKAELPFFILVILLIAGCGNESGLDTAASEVLAPPSVQSAVDLSDNLIRLDAGEAERLDIKTATTRAAEEKFALAMPGTVFPSPEHIALVSAPIAGRVSRIFAHEGERVRKGNALLELESLEFATLVADYLRAIAEETYYQQQVSRLTPLVEGKISSQSTLEKATSDLMRASAAVQAVSAQLKILGVTSGQLTAWVEGEESRPVLSIRAPITGIINEHLIDLGQAVSSYENMLSLINPVRVLIKGFLSPEEGMFVQAGDSVLVSFPQFSDHALPAAIKTINPAISESNKSITLNIIANTENGWPLPGQNVQLKVMATPPSSLLTIPLSAVQFEGDMSTVFVRKDATTFEKRAITISRVNEDKVLVNSGLEEGEEVAITQVFSLKALGRFDLYGEE